MDMITKKFFQCYIMRCANLKPLFNNYAFPEVLDNSNTFFDIWDCKYAVAALKDLGAFASTTLYLFCLKRQKRMPLRSRALAL
jgi:hypothetical protein